MSWRMCCIENCNTKDPDPDNRQLALFKVTQYREKQWLPAITPYLREGKSSRKHLYVCQLHFSPDDLQHIPASDPSGDRKFRVTVSSTGVPFGVNNSNNEQHQQNVSLDHSYHFVETDVNNVNFGLSDLLREVKLRELPPHWTFCEIDAGVLFIYTGDQLSYITRSMLIRPDMSVEVRGRNSSASNIIICDIKNTESIMSAMNTVTGRRVCTGVDALSLCPFGFVEIGSHSERCKNCRCERKRKLSAVAKSEKRQRERKIRLMRQVRQLKRKVIRLEKKCSFFLV